MAWNFRILKQRLSCNEINFDAEAELEVFLVVVESNFIVEDHEWIINGGWPVV